MASCRMSNRAVRVRLGTFGMQKLSFVVGRLQVRVVRKVLVLSELWSHVVFFLAKMVVSGTRNFRQPSSGLSVHVRPNTHRCPFWVSLIKSRWHWFRWGLPGPSFFPKGHLCEHVSGSSGAREEGRPHGADADARQDLCGSTAQGPSGGAFESAPDGVFFFVPKQGEVCGVRRLCGEIKFRPHLLAMWKMGRGGRRGPSYRAHANTHTHTHSPMRQRVTIKIG